MRKREHGSITIMTITTILFMIAFLASTFIIIENRRQSQEAIGRETREVYEEEVEKVDQVYDEVLEEAQGVCNHQWGEIETDETTGEQFVTCEICGKRENINNIPELSGIKSINVERNGNAYILMYDGTLYYYQYSGVNNEYVRYDVAHANTIMTNIDEYKGDGFVIQRDHQLNSLLWEEIIASNVKDMDYPKDDNNIDKAAYITTSNDLYQKMFSQTPELIASNVEEVKWEFSDYYFYKTTNNELYICYGTDPPMLLLNNVKDFNAYGVCLTETNDLYCFDFNNEVMMFVASNVAKFNRWLYYITSSGTLYSFDINNRTNTAMANGVSDLHDELYLKSKSLYFLFDTINSVSDDVKAFGYETFLTTSNDFYYLNGNAEKKASNVEKIDSEDMWYRTLSGDYYSR